MASQLDVAVTLVGVWEFLPEVRRQVTRTSGYMIRIKHDEWRNGIRTYPWGFSQEAVGDQAMDPYVIPHQVLPLQGLYPESHATHRILPARFHQSTAHLGLGRLGQVQFQEVGTNH